MPVSPTPRLLAIAGIAISSVALTACDENGAIVANSSSQVDSNSPVFSADAAAIDVAENSTEVIYTASASDADGDNLSYSINGDDANKFSIEASSGALQFISPPDYENPDDVDTDRVYELTVRANDGLTSDSMSLSINITDANDPPVTPANAVSINVAEDSTEVIYTASASDADGDELGYSIDGDDASKFSIGASSGALQFISPPDYENPDDIDTDRVYELNISADDGRASTSTSLTVNIIDINDPPVNIADAVVIYVAEDSTEVIYTASASDADGDKLSYSIDGDDASKFSIGTISGELQFISPPDYENPDDVNMDRVYELAISASDGIASASMNLSVNITNDNEPPVAVAAADQSVIMGGSASLDGSASSDSDGTITGYSWQLVDPDTELELSGAGQAQASFIAPAVTSVTSYTLRSPLSMTIKPAIALRLALASPP